MGADLESKEKVARGVAWASAASWGTQLLSFGIYTSLARLLAPQVFGLVAIAGMYIAFMQVFVNQGFGMAIIQRRELEREHLDSAFWIAMATAFFFCFLSLIFGSRIAQLFHEPRVAPVVGWLSLSFLFYALGSVPSAILTRELNFRALAVRSLIATAVGGVVGIAMAFFGLGVWSLVGQQLVSAILGCICLWLAVSWRPRFQISTQHLRDLYGFSLSLTGNDVLWFFAQKSDQTLVGYGFGPLGLGPYSLASRLVSLLHDGIIGPIQAVGVPAFSKLQSEPLRLERALYRFCELSSFVSLPVFAGIIVIAPELVQSLFGVKWMAAIPILQITAVYGALRILLDFGHPLLLAKGRPGLYVSMNIILAALTLVGCLIAVRWSPKAIAISMVVSMLLFGAIFVVIVGGRLEVRIGSLLKNFVFPGLFSLVMLTVVALVRGLIITALPPLTTMVICVVAGAVAYLSVALLIKPCLVKEILDMVRHMLFPYGSVREESLSNGRYVAKAVVGSPEAL